MYGQVLNFSKTLVQKLLGLVVLASLGGCTISASLEESLSGIGSEITPPVEVSRKNFFAAPADDSLQEQFIHGNVDGAKVFGSRLFLYGAIQSVGGYVKDSAKYSTDTGQLEASTVDDEFLGKADSKVFVGRVDALEQYMISSLDLTTGTKTDLVQLDGTVRCLKIHNGKLYILGFFTLVNGSARTNFAIVDANTGALSATNISVVYTGSYPGVGDLSVTDDYIAIAADMLNVNGTSVTGRVALIKQADSTVSSPNIAGFRPYGDEFRLAFSGGVLFVGGKNSSSYPRLMKLNLTDMTSVAVAEAELTIASNRYYEIQHLLAHGSELIVVGRFGRLGAANVSGVFSVDASTLAIQHSLDLDIGSLQRVGVYDEGASLLFVPKSYGNGREIHFHRLSKSDLSVEKTYTLTDSSPFGDVDSFFSHGDDLYIKGSFVLPRDTKEKFGMLAYDLENGKVLDWEAPSIEANWVSAWTFHGDWVYLAGQITKINGSATNGLAAFNLRTGESRTWDINVTERYIESMAVLDNVLYMTGSDWAPSTLNLETGEEQSTDISGRWLYSTQDHLILLRDVWLPEQEVSTDLAALTRNGDLALAADDGLAIPTEKGIVVDENTFYTFSGSEWWQFNLTTGAHTEAYLEADSGFPLDAYQGKLLGFRGSSVTDLTVFNSAGQAERTLNLKTLGRIAE